MKLQGPTEVKFKPAGGQNLFCSLRSPTYPFLSHLQNDGATVERSTVMLLQIKLEILCF